MKNQKRVLAFVITLILVLQPLSNFTVLADSNGGSAAAEEALPENGNDSPPQESEGNDVSDNEAESNEDEND